jgi:hypothetical protein
MQMMAFKSAIACCASLVAFGQAEDVRISH